MELQLRVRYHLVQTDEDGNAILDGTATPFKRRSWTVTYYMNGLASWRCGQFVSAQTAGYEILPRSIRIRSNLPREPSCSRAIMGIGAEYHFGGKALFLLGYFGNAHPVDLVAVPAFWLGMLLQLFFIILKDATGGVTFSMPISGAGGSSSQYQAWMHYVLPTITLASVSTAYAARIMRSQLLDVMNQDYIRTAKAKGLSNRAIVVKHALKNALIPSLPIWWVSTLAACFRAPS